MTGSEQCACGHVLDEHRIRGRKCEIDECKCLGFDSDKEYKEDYEVRGGRRMTCPICNSDNIEVPTVEVDYQDSCGPGTNYIQCGPAFCVDCGATQDGEDLGRWYEGSPQSSSPSLPDSHLGAARG